MNFLKSMIAILIFTNSAFAMNNSVCNIKSEVPNHINKQIRIAKSNFSAYLQMLSGTGKRGMSRITPIIDELLSLYKKSNKYSIEELQQMKIYLNKLAKETVNGPPILDFRG